MKLYATGIFKDLTPYLENEYLNTKNSLFILKKNAENVTIYEFWVKP